MRRQQLLQAAAAALLPIKPLTPVVHDSGWFKPHWELPTELRWDAVTWEESWANTMKLFQ